MASMERRVRNGKTTWRVVWRDPQGKKKSKTFPNEGTPKNPGAKQFKAEIEQALNTGNYYDSSRGKITVGEWAQVWLESKGDLKASSKERYAGIIRTHIDPRWGKTPLSAVKHAEVQQWATKLDRAPATITKVHRALSLMLDLAVADGRLVKNPAHRIKLQRPDVGDLRALDYAQLERLAEDSGEDWQLIVRFLGYTGLRFGEMAALRVSRLDLDRRRVHVVESVTPVNGKGLIWGMPKTYERRRVPIPAFLIDELRAQIRGLEPNDLVFRGPRGGVVRTRILTRAGFHAAAIGMGLCEWVPDPTPKNPGRKKAIKVFHPHELRHTAASMAIASGADVKVVQLMLGHKDASVTLNQYGHLFHDNLDVVTDAMTAARKKALGESDDSSDEDED